MKVSDAEQQVAFWAAQCGAEQEEVRRLKTLNEALNASLVEAQRVNGELLAALEMAVVDLIHLGSSEDWYTMQHYRTTIAAARSQS
jgi:hypothetical protein